VSRNGDPADPQPAPVAPFWSQSGREGVNGGKLVISAQTSVTFALVAMILIMQTDFTDRFKDSDLT